jgi:hypothetical protein
MNIEDASHSLWEHLLPYIESRRVVSIIRSGTPDQPKLLVFLASRKWMRPDAIPDTWEGFPVVTKVTGPIRLCGAAH